jgi:acyl-CoA dehydrogenase
MSEPCLYPSEHDVDAMLDVLARRARQVQPAGQGGLVEASRLAWRELGLLSAHSLSDGGSQPACGLWDAPELPAMQRLSVQALALWGQVSPAAAFALHTDALAARLARLHGLEPAAGAVLTLEGRWGLGRAALARTLSGQPLVPDQAAWLADVWALPGQSPRLLCSAPDWASMWWLQWREADGWQWCHAPRAGLAVQQRPHAHGLDALAMQHVGQPQAGTTPSGAPWPSQCHHASLASVVEALYLYGLGLLAISTGAAQAALARAQAYALQRQQGGHRIDAHGAVQLLLAGAQQAVWLARSALQTLQSQAPGLDALAGLWQARAHLQGALSQAGSDALQVLGGIGYVREAGAEQSLRDLGTLRQLGGSPPELSLCAHALQGLRQALSPGLAA